MPTLNTITNDFYWIGVRDPHLRIFDIVMETEFGTTYNSYLLKGSEKIAVFETAKDKFSNTYIENLKACVDPSQIDYIIINHTEPDHSGALIDLLNLAPHATVVGSTLALKYLTSILNRPFNALKVKDGDTLSLGNKTIRFLSTPMLHWPDTIYSYIEEDGILVTCDSFGAHFSSDHILRSTLPASSDADYLSAFNYYYSMIMGPFKPFVLKALKKIEGLTLNYICPSHGLVLDRSNISEFVAYYKEWSTPSEPTDPLVVIPYVSAYGYTKDLAFAISEGVQETLPTATIKLYDLSYDSITEAMQDAGACDGLLIGSPTILSDTLPQMWQLLSGINPVIHAGKLAACFGSYGWSGEAMIHLMERFNQLKLTTPLEPFSVCFKPSEEELVKAREFGCAFAKHIPTKH